MTNKHLLNAETQVAAELKLLVDRFITAKKNRPFIALKIKVKADELKETSEMVHARDPQLPAPIPPLASVHSRQAGETIKSMRESMEKTILRPKGELND